MVNVNKESVREEVARIKSEFDRLSVDKQINDETKAITNQGTNGKGKMELKETAYNTRTIESSTVISVSECRAKIDIVFEKVVENVEVKSCSNCNKIVKGEMPQDIAGPLQYGNGLKTYIINLLVSQMITLNRIQKLIKTFIGEILSEATLLKFIFRFNQVLKALEKLLRSSVMHVDETSLRIDKKNNWIHVYSAGDITLKFLYRKRGSKAIKELPPIPANPTDKCGKLAKSDAHNLWKRLKKYESSVLLFANKTEVSFTNNRAKQDIRMAKVKQKVSGCFRISSYAQAYCRLSSYLQTMASKGYNPLIAIQMTLAGKIVE